MKGYIWLRRFAFLDEPVTTWVVVAPNGTPVAYASMNSAFEPMQIDEAFIAGVLRDELDREQVAVVSLMRTE